MPWADCAQQAPGQDVEAVRQATAALGESMQKIGAAMYENAEGQAAEGDADPSAEGDGEAEGTVEGEFREVKEDEPEPEAEKAEKVEEPEAETEKA